MEEHMGLKSRELSEFDDYNTRKKAYNQQIFCRDVRLFLSGKLLCFIDESIIANTFAGIFFQVISAS